MSAYRALAAINLQPTDRIPQVECLQHPEFERVVTGIDPYQHPQQARLALLEKLDLDLALAGVPATDHPIENPFADGESSITLANGRHAVRWGATATSHWDWGQGFNDVRQVLDYDPLIHLPAKPLPELAEQFQRDLDRRCALSDNRYLETCGTYTTLFMWPLMTFGWELFLEAAASEPARFKELLDGFAQVTECTLRALALTDVEVITCHDDLCMTRGSVFSPAWLEEMIYPHYTRFWQILHDAKKKVIFISDGRVNPIADAIFTCGADGLFAEPHTDLEPLITRYGDRKVFLGNIDTRILRTGDRVAIEAEVLRCVRMGQNAAGYFIGVTNEITYDIPVENVFTYFALCEEHCRR